MSGAEFVEIAGARVGLWRDAPSLSGLRTAALGAFSCADAASGAGVLDHAAARLAREGYGAVLGPMDGDTWSTHRLVVEGDASPPFLMEPNNPAHYPAAFDAAGFGVAARYVSSHTTVGATPRVLSAPGVTLRPFDKKLAARELRRLYLLASAAFAANVFYKPISEERFIAVYSPFVSALDQDLSLLAEDETGELVGFLFGYPNYAEGPETRTAVIKTVASSKPGVGAMMLRAAHLAAQRRGFTRVIHALMHEANPSSRLSRIFGGRPFRRYALWGKRL